LIRRAVRIALLALSTATACDPAEPPNVVLVSIDTLRADALGVAGGPVPTPTLDALAREGVLFERAIAPAPETAPSHATLFTGLDVLEHGVLANGAAVPDELPTLAESFREAGYATAAFVSSFVLDPRFGWSRGFEHYDASFPTAGATLSKQRAYPGAFWAEHEFEGFDRRAPETTREALAWLESAPEPFFLFVHYFDPHAPYRPPEPFDREAKRGRYDLAGRGVRGVPPRALAQMIRRYHAEVLYADHWLGRLLAGLARRGARDRTLVVVTADHGEGLGQHGWLEHGMYLYDEQVAVPLLFHWPGRIVPRQPISTAVGLVDAAGAVAALAGVRAPSGAAESPLADVVLGGGEPPSRVLFGFRRRLPTQQRRSGEALSVRRGRWKYLRVADARDELYDVGGDPDELQDLVRQRADVARQLRELLDAHVESAPERRPVQPLGDEERRGLEALGYIVE
jgi:arylsulfatase A-like enzyme